MQSNRRYDVTFRKLIDMILQMNADERALLLKDAERIRAKIRAIRKKCYIPIMLYHGEGMYCATITNLSFRGAFIDLLIPVMIGDEIKIKFKNSEGLWDLLMESRIVHVTSWGVGIRFKSVSSRAAQFLQKTLDGCT
jgi:hypothetical protein